MVNWDHARRDITIYNDIFHTTGGVPLLVVPPGYQAFFAGNLYWAGNQPFVINYGGQVYHELDDWRRATGNERLHNRPTGLVADPKLGRAGAATTDNTKIRFSTPSCQLSPASPAIDQGLDLTALGIDAGGRDLWRNAAPQGKAPDIGAFESRPVTVHQDNDVLPVEESVANAELPLPRLFPNPVIVGQPVQLQVETQVLGAVLADSGGRIIQVLESTVSRIETTGLGAGLYFLLLTGENGSLLRLPLVVQR